MNKVIVFVAIDPAVSVIACPALPAELPHAELLFVHAESSRLLFNIPGTGVAVAKTI